jgi:ABC-type Na+ efflux pump permease subunit
VVSGALEGDFGGTAVAAGLLALAVAAGAHGLGHLAGPAGLAVASLLFVLLGLSSSGGAVGYEFEPGFYGALSQLLPPGAAVTFVRNVEYFDWAATLTPLLVLLAWALGGFALGLLGERVRRPQQSLA